MKKKKKNIMYNYYTGPINTSALSFACQYIDDEIPMQYSTELQYSGNAIRTDTRRNHLGKTEQPKAQVQKLAGTVHLI